MKKTSNDRKDYYLVPKGSIHQEDIAILKCTQQTREYCTTWSKTDNTGEETSHKAGGVNTVSTSEN